MCVHFGGKGGGDFPLFAPRLSPNNKSKSSSLSCTYRAVAPVLLSYCGCWIWQGPLGSDWRKKNAQIVIIIIVIIVESKSLIRQPQN